jgi:hypothetical protein
VQLFRERRTRRDRDEREESVQLRRLGGYELAVPAKNVARVGEVVDHRAGLNGAHRMAVERERRDDAEVPAAAANRPEQVALAFGVGLNDRAVGENDRRRDEIVDRQSTAARQMTDASAEREAPDTGGRDDSCRHRKPVLVRRPVDVAERGTALHAHHSRARVDAHDIHGGEIDHEPAIDAREAGAVVPAAPDRDRQPALAGETDRRRNVCFVGAVRNRRRVLVDHRVVERPRIVVALSASLDDAALNCRSETLDRNGHRDLLRRTSGSTDCTPIS